MKKIKTLILFLISIIVVSCNSGKSSETITFKMLEGTIEKPVSMTDAPYDSISLNYKIAWPIEGDKEAVSYLQSWIINGITKGSSARNAKMTIEEILESIADEMTEDENYVFSKNISVSAEENVPFDSYLTLNLGMDGFIWMSPHPEFYSDALTVRMTDGAVFQPDKAIRDEEKMRLLIGENLEKRYKKEISDWQWSNEITSCNRYDIPLPHTPISITKDGVLVQYEVGEISFSAAGDFSCIIPFDEVKYVLTDAAKSFLSISDAGESDNEDKTSVKTADIQESEIIDLIKKANLHEAGSLSKSFLSACEKDGKNPFLKYGDYPDCVFVEEPDIKILKIMPDSKDGRKTVVFDFIDKTAPHMGWISKQDYNQKICAMDLVNEDGKWVVDDFFEAWDATLESFNKEDANSAKANFLSMGE